MSLDVTQWILALNKKDLLNKDDKETDWLLQRFNLIEKIFYYKLIVLANNYLRSTVNLINNCAKCDTNYIQKYIGIGMNE